MRNKEDIWTNSCDKCGKIVKEGDLCHNENFGGALCPDCQNEDEKTNQEIWDEDEVNEAISVALRKQKEEMIKIINEELTYYPMVAGKPTEWSKGLIHLAKKLKMKIKLERDDTYGCKMKFIDKKRGESICGLYYYDIEDIVFCPKCQEDNLNKFGEKQNA